MAKTIRLKAGESAKIFHRSLSSLPMDFQFQALALDGGKPDGEIEIRGSDWIFLKSPVRQPLQEHNVVQDRKSTRLNSSHSQQSRMPSSA